MGANRTFKSGRRITGGVESHRHGSRWAYNPKVAGSNPALATSKRPEIETSERSEVSLLRRAGCLIAFDAMGTWRLSRSCGLVASSGVRNDRDRVHAVTSSTIGVALASLASVVSRPARIFSESSTQSASTRRKRSRARHAPASRSARGCRVIGADSSSPRALVTAPAGSSPARCRCPSADSTSASRCAGPCNSHPRIRVRTAAPSCDPTSASTMADASMTRAVGRRSQAELVTRSVECSDYGLMRHVVNLLDE